MLNKEQNKLFAKNLNYYIEKSGMTQKEFAKAVGVGYTTLNNWCLGKNMPSMGKIQRLADYLKVGKSALVDKRDTETYYLNEYTAKIAQEIYENRKLGLLFDAARGVSSDDLKLVHDMLLRMKKSEKGEN